MTQEASIAKTIREIKTAAEPAEYGHGAEDSLGVLLDALLQLGWPHGRVRALARIVRSGIHHDEDAARWLRPLWQDERLCMLLNASLAWPVDGLVHGPDNKLPCSLASLLTADWRWFSDVYRNTLVLMHGGGLWVEMDADSVHDLDYGAARAIADALWSHVERGATGKHIVIVGFESRDGGRAWYANLDHASLESAR